MGLKTWLGLKKPHVSPFASDFPGVGSHAQLHQDLWVLSETGSKRGGYFVEIGAFDGISMSNTYLLERDYGWTGIIAEPNPLFSEVIRGTRSSPLCTDPVDGISGKDVTMLFVASAPELSAMAEHAFNDRLAPARRTGEPTVQRTISLNDLLKKNDAPAMIDFISIDTEGNEPDILSGFDFHRYEVRLFAIEHNHRNDRKIDRIMLPRGYERVHREWSQWDAWYRKRSA